MPQGHRGEVAEQIGVLRFVPIGGELGWASHEDGFAFERQRLSRLEPRLECLLRQLLPRAGQESGPGFSGRCRHSDCWKNFSGGDRRNFGWREKAIERLCSASWE